MCVLSVLMFPSMVIRYNMGWYEMLLIDVPLFFAATFSFCNFYMVCQREIHTRLARAAQVRAVPDVGRHRPVDQQHARGVRGAVQQAERVHAHAEVPHRGRRRRVGREEVPPVGGRAAAHRARARPLFHGDGLLRARQRHLRRRCRSWCSSRSGSSTPACSRSSSSTPATKSSPRGCSPAARALRIRIRSQESRIRGRSKVAVIRVTPEHHPPRHRSPRRARRRVGRARAAARRRSSRTTSPGTSRSRRRTPRRGSSRARSRRWRARGFTDQVCVQNKTVVTNAFKGEDLNHYVPIFKRYDIPVLYNFKDEDMTWVRLQAEGADARARPHLPRGHPRPRLLLRQEHRPPADDQVPHLHDDDRRDEERVRRAAEHAPALHALVDPRDAGRPARTSRRRSTPASSRSWTARPPATARGRGRCIRS